jgi:hypothetical protein
MHWKRGSEGAEKRHAAEHPAVIGEAWEYLMEEGDSRADRQQRRCNQLGTVGWELVTVIPLSRPLVTDGGRTTGTKLFFKRRL